MIAGAAPPAVCVRQDKWSDLDISERARLNARQRGYHLQQVISVLKPEPIEPVPTAGETIGEIMFKGNIQWKAIFENEEATKVVFKCGWFDSGALAIVSPNGYVKIKDRSKDVITSGKTFLPSRWRMHSTASCLDWCSCRRKKKT